MSKRPGWWLDFLKLIWPMNRLSAKATQWPVIGRLLTPIVTPLFTGNNFNISYVPVNARVPEPQNAILPKRLIEEIIRRSSYRVILKRCSCRDSAHCRTYPVQDACLLLGDEARAVDPRIARHASVEETLSHLHAMLGRGLIPMVGRVLMDNYFYGIPNTGRLLTICFCCPCCCTILKSARYFPSEVNRSLVRLKGVSITVDEKKCRGCGNCADSCLLGAITMREGAPARDDTLCKGCGHCASVCPEGAVTLSLASADESVAELMGRISERVKVE